jgi:hypothetical protein
MVEETKILTSESEMKASLMLAAAAAVLLLNDFDKGDYPSEKEARAALEDHIIGIVRIWKERKRDG